MTPVPEHAREVAPPERWLGLDGLRGIAVLSVLLFHHGFTWARGSFLAVSLFFTLSGYLVTTRLIQEAARDGKIDVVRFWGRRLRRIAPAAWLALLFVCLFGVLAATPAQRVLLRGDVWAALANVTNWRLLSAGRSYAALFSDPSPLQHFWALAIEEQFHLVFPWIVAACAAWALRRAPAVKRVDVLRGVLASVAVLLGVASIAAQLGIRDKDHVYYGTDSRSWELFAGVLLACVLTGKPIRRGVARAVAAIGAVAFVLMLFVWSRVAFGAPWLYLGGLAAFALINVSVASAATVPGPVRWLCSWKPWVWLGLVSYGLYLFHWPVFLWLDERRTGLSDWALFLVRGGATGALAVASYVLVEAPIRAGVYPTRWRAPVAWMGGVAWVAVAAALVPTPRGGVVIMQSDFLRAERLARDARGTTAMAGSADRAAAAAAGVPVPLRVYVVGDSTASLFAGGLALQQAETGLVDVRSAAIATCGFVRVDQVRWGDGGSGPPKEECAHRPAQWRKDLAAELPDAILVVGGAMNTASFRRSDVAGNAWTNITEPAGSAAVAAGMDDTLAALQAAAPGVPLLWFTAPYTDRLRLRDAPAGDTASVPARIDAYNAMVASLAREHPGVVVVRWADYANDLSVEDQAHLMTDGFHALPEAIGEIVRDWAWSRITMAYVEARAQQALRVR